MTTWTTLRGVALGTWVLASAACGALDVSDPTAIEESDVNNATGADLLRRDAVTKLYSALSWAVPRTGLLTDEFVGDFDGELDRRASAEYEESGRDPGYGLWHEARRAATLALPVLRTYGAQATAQAYIGEMFAVRGSATVALAESFCPGFPLHEVVDFTPVYGTPLSTDDVFERALADLDSAIAAAADSADILNFARIARGRALLGLGRFADAGTAVHDVPTPYTWNAEYDYATAQVNRLGFQGQPFSAKNVSVADQEGGNGLDYMSAADPRVTSFPMDHLGDTANILTKYPDASAPIVIASGIEARLIEAEAVLRAGGDWLGLLNTLRTDGTQTAGVWNAGTGGVAGLAPLTDPVDPDARVDLLFRERAFWLFGTSHRLGDLRRLIAYYGRAADDLFPTGVYTLGGAYGPATSIPFRAILETPFSPTVTGCTSR